MKYILIKIVRDEIYNIREVLYDLISDSTPDLFMVGVLNINISDCLLDIAQLMLDAKTVENCHDDVMALTDLQTIAEDIQERLKILEHHSV